MSNLVYVIIMLVFLLLSAFFSATETAFLSMNMTRMRTMAENGDKRAQLVCSLEGRYDKLISTLLIGNNIVNIGLASLGTVVFVHIYGDIGATISTAVVTVAVLIFGEISPKSLAKDFPERFAMFSAPAISMLMWFFTPLNFLFSKWKALLGRIIKVKNDTRMSQEELLMFVEEVQADGSINETERDLLRNAIEFTDRRAIDILTHRVDLEAVSLDSNAAELAGRFSDTKFSRLLVYDGSIDNIVGIINHKDFYTGTGVSERPVSEIMTPPIFIPKSGKISEILKSLQKNKSHIAVILDEYGGTLGIVTMEDILEELVGEIWDEHDEVVEAFRKTGENTYIVDASVDFSDFTEFFDIEPDEDAVSISGWMAELLGRMPETGDVLSYDELKLEVMSTDNHRVSSLKVEIEKSE